MHGVCNQRRLAAVPNALDRDTRHVVAGTGELLIQRILWFPRGHEHQCASRMLTRQSRVDTAELGALPIEGRYRGVRDDVYMQFQQ
jgi:hypothetical protein